MLKNINTDSAKELTSKGGWTETNTNMVTNRTGFSTTRVDLKANQESIVNYNQKSTTNDLTAEGTLSASGL